MMKKLTAALLAALMPCTLLPLGAVQASAAEAKDVSEYKDCPLIQVGETATICTGRYMEDRYDLNYYYDYLRFIPEHDGMYTFSWVRKEGSDLSFDLKDAESNYSATLDYDTELLYCNIDFLAEAGETYYLEANSRDAFGETAEVTLTEPEGAGSLSIDGADEISMSFFDEGDVTVNVAAEDYRASLLRCVSSDEDIAEAELVSDMDYFSLAIHTGKKEGTATLTVLDPTGLSASVNVKVTAPDLSTRVETGYDYDADEEYKYAVRWFTFTPEQDGKYDFEVSGFNTSAATGERLALTANVWVDNKWVPDVFDEYDLVPTYRAGETYYVRAESSPLAEDYEDVELTLKTEKRPDAESIAFAMGEEATVSLLDGYIVAEIIVSPERALVGTNEIEFSSSAPDVAEYMSFNRFVLKKTGEAVLTAKTKDGLTATCKLIVAMPDSEEIVLNETKAVKGDQLMKFTPKSSGYYTFQSQSDSGVDTYAELLDEDGNMLTYNDDDGEAYNFSITYECEAGKTYFLRTRSYGSGDDAEYFVSVTGEEEDVMLGDVNGDGAVDVTDATQVQLRAAGLAEFTDEQQAAADVNGDGVVDVTDATRIQLFAAGLITEF